MKKRRWIVIILLGSIAVVFSAVLVFHQLGLKQLKGYLTYTSVGDGGAAPQSYEYSFDRKAKNPVTLNGYSRIYLVASAENGVVFAAVSQSNEHCIVSQTNEGKQTVFSVDVPTGSENSPVSALAAAGGKIVYQLQDGALYQLDLASGKPAFLTNGKVRGTVASMGGGVLFEQTVDGANWISRYQNGTVEPLCPGAMPLIHSDEAFLYYSEDAQAVLEYRFSDKTSAPSELAYVPERYTSFDEFRPPVVKDGWVIGCEKTFRYDTPIPGAKFKLTATNLKTGRRLTVPGFSGERVYHLIWVEQRLIRWNNSQPAAFTDSDPSNEPAIKGTVTLLLQDENGYPCPNARVGYTDFPYDVMADLGETDENGHIVWENISTGPQELIIQYEDGNTAVFEGKIKESYFNKTVLLKPAKEYKINGRTTPSYKFAGIS